MGVGASAEILFTRDHFSFPQGAMFMSDTVTVSTAPALDAPDQIEAMQHWLLHSPAVSAVLIVGLPVAGMLSSLFLHLPLFATFMASAFLLATSLVCRRAILTFAGTTLRLLVTARTVLILVLAALLFCATGAVWTALVSALVLWFVSDRLLGRRALHDLWKRCRS
jgi:hypothetical protein